MLARCPIGRHLEPLDVVRVRRQVGGHDAATPSRSGALRPYGNSTATEATQKAKKSAGANLLTLVYLGSPTWARTRDLRINSPALYQLSYRG